MVNSINFSDKNSKTQQIQNTAASSLVAGGSAYAILKYAFPKINSDIVKKNFHKLTLEEAEKDLFIKEAQNIIDSGKLAEYGLKIKLIDGNFTHPDTKLKRTIDSIKSKNNACYVGKEKTIYINRDFLAPVFHEMGHAEAYRKGFAGTLAKIRHITNNKYITIGLPLIALFTTKKTPSNGQELNKKEKFFNIVRSGTGVICAAGMLPKLADEKLASIYGKQMAKKSNLNGKLLKIVENCHRTGFNTYLRGFFAYAVVVTAAIQAKDYLQEKLPLIRKNFLAKV